VAGEIAFRLRTALKAGGVATAAGFLCGSERLNDSTASKQISVGRSPYGQVRHAMTFVNRNFSTFDERTFLPVRQQFGKADLARVETCLSMHIGHTPLR